MAGFVIPSDLFVKIVFGGVVISDSRYPPPTGAELAKRLREGYANLEADGQGFDTPTTPAMPSLPLGHPSLEPIASGAGGLGSDALKELWCWLWAGIAEREHRIWRELRSSRDVRREMQACVDLQDLLLRRISVPEEDGFEQLQHFRLGGVIQPSAAERFEAELRDGLSRARRDANGSELQGNDGDAMKLVLRSFIPIFARLRASARSAEPNPSGGLTPTQAFRFHAWLASTVDMLDEGAGTRAFAAAEAWRRALPAMRMVLAQWVASLPSGPSGSFDLTWRRLALGMAPAAFHAFAAWLASEAGPVVPEPKGTRVEVARALMMLARTSGRTEEELRGLATSLPPWSPPDAMPSAYLGGRAKAGDCVIGTIVDNSVSPEARQAVPFHQFLAALDHG